MDIENLLQVLVLCCTYSMGQATRSIDDYCWRDYDGTLPPDALAAGAQYSNREPIFIGQTLYGDKIVPGKLYNNDKKIYFEYFSTEYSTENGVKILCSQNPTKFEWIPTQHTVVRTLTNKILIRGGSEPKCTTYLGRTKTAEGVVPGKVMCCEGATDCYGLYTTLNGTGTLHGDFEILTYNENRSTSSDTVIEVPVSVPVRTTPKRCKKITVNVFN